MLINMVLPGADVSNSGSSGEPLEFSYSGNYTDNRVNGIGTVTLNTSGTLTVTSGTATVSAYLRAGGGGCTFYKNSAYSGYIGTGGGGGYQTVTVELTAGTYEIVVGAGGDGGGYLNPGTSENKKYAGADGGDTVAFGYTCTGGKAGNATSSSSSGGAGGTPNGSAGMSVSGGSAGSVAGGPPNGGKLSGGTANNGGDGYVELTFI